MCKVKAICEIRTEGGCGQAPLWIAVHAMAWMWLAACSGGGEGQGAAGSDDLQGASDIAFDAADAASTWDASTTDAEGGSRSDLGGADAEGDGGAPECTAPEECGVGKTCDCTGSCVPVGALPCTEQKNCGSGRYCDTCAGYCVDLLELCEPCTESAQCKGQGSACLDFSSGGRFCTLGCLSDVGCLPGFTCAAVSGLDAKQCLPKSGSCAAPGECKTDADCPFPQICNAAQLVCSNGCTDDLGCPNDLVCVAGHCIAPCDDVANPCPKGQECTEGKCRVPGGCLSPADCAEPETHCDTVTNMCAPGCIEDFDCKSTQKVCADGDCVDKSCSGNFSCAFGQVCAVSTGQCEAADGPYCEACQPDSDTSCTSVDPANVCATLQNDEGQDVGAFCLVACGADPENPCPQGYQCKELEVAEGELRSLCVRACHIPPVGPN